MQQPPVPAARVPKWLSQDFLEKALRSYRNDATIQLITFEFSHNGFIEHFASQMYSCKMEFKSLKYPKDANEKLNVVIKAEPPTDDLKSAMVSNGPLFKTEILMYTETLPTIKDLFERNGLKYDLTPELIYATDHPFPVLILKDARDEGLSAHRLPPEELEDSKLIIQQLARFHAASYFLAENNEHDFERYSNNIYENKGFVDNFFVDTMRAFRELVSTWDEFKHQMNKVDKFIENFTEVGKSCYTRNIPGNGNGYNILNHGDFHTRNLMFKFNDVTQRMERFNFIDFQMCVYCSPAIDVIYMLGVIKRDENFDLPVPQEEIIMFYHEEFVSALKKFGYIKSPPSLLDLNIELLKYGAINMFIYIGFLSFNFVDWDETNVNDVLSKSKSGDENIQSKIKMMQNPICERILKDGLKSWITKGFL